LPLLLDEMADGLHSDLPLTILRALVEALRINEAAPELPAHVGAQQHPLADFPP
jgi:hypothetical protein